MTHPLLPLIEQVSPEDVAGLDEIDARVWCYRNEISMVGFIHRIKGMDFIKTAPENIIMCWDDKCVTFAQNNNAFDDYFRPGDYNRATVDNIVVLSGNRFLVPSEGQFPLYTRSRDALKAIRPDGWRFEFKWVSSGTIFYYSAQRKNKTFISAAMPTEELAELHAIIQAIERERGEG